MRCECFESSWTIQACYPGYSEGWGRQLPRARDQLQNQHKQMSNILSVYLSVCRSLSRYLCVCVHMCVYTQIHTYIHIAGYVVSHLTIMENTALLDKIVKTLASFWITIPICIYLWVLLNISFFKKLQWLPTPLPLKQWFLCRGHSLKGVCFLR